MDVVGIKSEEFLPDDGADPYAALSPRTRRKRKNRDQMRAARQRERETMDRLRATVERLEEQYRKLQLEKPVKEETPPPPADAGADFSIASAVNGFVTAPHGKQPSADEYAALISLKSQAQEENFLLKQALYEKNKHKEALERVVSDLVAPTEEELHIMKEEFPPVNEDDFAMPAPSQPLPPPTAQTTFAPMTQETVWDIIGDAHRRMTIVQQRLRGPLHSAKPTTGTISIITPSDDTSPSSPTSSPLSPDSSPLDKRHSTGLPPFCGWDVSHCTENNHLWFAFDKAFPHITAHHAMERMWDNEHKMMTYRDARAAQHQSLGIIQEINEDTYIFERRLVDPATQRIVVSTYLRFRMRMAEGFLIGFANIRPNYDEPDEVWASQACVWTEFLPLMETAGCAVRITGTTNCDNPTNAHRHVADVIIGLLRWEYLNIGPTFTLTDR